MLRHRIARRTPILAASALVLACSGTVDQPTTPRVTPKGVTRDVVSGAPQLVIVEVMADPSKVADAAGEYIKLYNPGPIDLDLQGYKVLSAFGTTVYNGSTSVESHTIASSVPLPVGACVVLGNTTASASNGGITTEAYSYGTAITLGNNNTDWVEIKTPTGVLLDSVSYSASTINTSVSPATRTITTAYSTQTGIARLVVDPSIDHTVEAGANWVSATTTYGLGDKGTPNDCQYTWRSGGGSTAGPLDHVVITGGTTVVAGATMALTASPQDANNKPIATATIAWSSDRTDIATVDNSGVVTGVAPNAQTAKITATATDNGITKSMSQQVTVTPPEIHWIDLSSSSSSFPPGFQTQLFATARVASGGTVINATFTFESLDPTIATVAVVQNTGIVTGVSGSATKPRIKVTAVPVGGGTAYEFTSTPITIETPVASPPTTYSNNSEFGLPSPASPMNANDLLIARPQYTLSYNESRGTPNWVSYELDSRQIVVGQDRCNCFTGDPMLPANKQIFTSDYTNGGFDRGHMTRSADRTTANVDNASTFYLTNIVPQQADLNQGVWAQFENALGDSATKGGRAVYIITGPIFAPSHPLVFLKNEGKVAVPDSTWKVALIGPRNGGVPFTVGSVQSWDDLAGLTVLAVNMPNVAGVRNDPWQKYLTTVDRIEQSTGLDVLSLLPIAFQTAIEAGDHPPTASFTLSGTQDEGSALALDASASSDPDIGHPEIGRTEALSYAWNFGDGTVGSGKTPSKTYANNGVFTVTLTVTDIFGWQKATSRVVSIGNVAPQIAPFNGATILQHETYMSPGSFTDPGADAWVASVNYGDGSGNQPLTLTGKTFSLAHAFASAGTFTVTVSVTDGDALSTRTATVIVESAAQGIGHLDDTVQGLDGSLNGGQINSLRSKLKNASAQLDKGNAGPAANMLSAFANEVQATIDSGRLSDASGAPILAYVRRVIASIGGL
jgi:endonuclease G